MAHDTQKRTRSSSVCPRHPCSPWARISRVQIVNACFVQAESDAHAGIHHARGYLNRRAHTHESLCLHRVLVPVHACCAAFVPWMSSRAHSPCISPHVLSAGRSLCWERRDVCGRPSETHQLQLAHPLPQLMCPRIPP